jgi:acetylornithine deacetylase/succinyl-diaminopimelate desuccinylase-like protein
MLGDTTATASSAEAEVVDLLSELLQIDTSNPGATERPAAEWTAARLAEAGIDSRIVESAPGRASVIARVAGSEGHLSPLLVHGHLDVVPADPHEWTVHPFSGEVRDGYVWGRGAVDMKGMDAMVLALVRHWARSGQRPARDIVLAFVADEEAGGAQGARFLIDRHAELFAGCTEAISEIGGFSVSLDSGARLYLAQTAEKGINWLRLRARGRAGHGSMEHEDNVVTTLAGAVSRIGAEQHRLVVTDSVRRMVDALAEVTGLALDADEPEKWLPLFGAAARMVGAALRNTTNPTMFDAGYKENVVPSTAEAVIDARFLPGHEDELLARLAELAGPQVEISSVMRADAVECSFEGALVDTMSRAIRDHDPSGHLVPYMTSGGTDAKSFARLGMRCFGFAPLMLPPSLDFTALFHGVDERVPIDGLQFGTRVLDQVLRSA